MEDLIIKSKHSDDKIPIPPFSKHSHILIIYAIAKGMADAERLDDYLELGVSKGACFNVIAPLAKRAYAIDVDKNSRRYIQHNKNLIWDRARATKFLGNNPQYNYDLIFIDAKHSFKDGLRDFNAAVPRLKHNGIILMHDTYPPNKEYMTNSYCGTTWKVVRKIRKEMSDKFEVVTLPFYYGITIIRKAHKILMHPPKKVK